jgi:hypothetical protein
MASCDTWISKWRHRASLCKLECLRFAITAVETRPDVAAEEKVLVEGYAEVVVVVSKDVVRAAVEVVGFGVEVKVGRPASQPTSIAMLRPGTL